MYGYDTYGSSGFRLYGVVAGMLVWYHHMVPYHTIPPPGVEKAINLGDDQSVSEHITGQKNPLEAGTAVALPQPQHSGRLLTIPILASTQPPSLSNSS